MVRHVSHTWDRRLDPFTLVHMKLCGACECLRGLGESALLLVAPIPLFLALPLKSLFSLFALGVLNYTVKKEHQYFGTGPYRAHPVAGTELRHRG